MAPDQVLLLARLRSAPVPDGPVPFRVIGSAMARPLPSTWTAAPLATIVVPAAVPRAAFAARRDDTGADRRGARIGVDAAQDEGPGTVLGQAAGAADDAARGEGGPGVGDRDRLGGREGQRQDDGVRWTPTPVAARFPTPSATELPDSV